jgi:hypothetical protein
VIGGLDFVHPKPQPAGEVVELFAGMDVEAGDRLVAFGWAMAEDLAGGKLGR